ncbi:MAG: 50S ribosomal protein L11 methyltransferase [Gemmatimonadota bacterium]|nr:50S ribosomal protein L11 methyltransferase [Gemmatimonadota bacterium]
MNSYFQVSVVLPRARVEVVSAELFELGCCGVVEEDISDGVRLTAYFEVAENKAEIEQALRPYECRFEPVPDTDWTLGWRSFFQPVYPTPRMAICPPWDRVPDPPGGFTIAIDPQMAFGTGHHETTRLALLGLEKKITSGDRVLDVGTGSGILSIAAVKLGAAKVMAVDIEAAAIENARANCVLNGVDAQVVLMQCSVDRVSGIFDVVVANIISSILLPIVPELAKRLHPEGYAILGGILDREREAFCTALDRANLVLDEMLDDGEWLCAIARKSQ